MREAKAECESSDNLNQQNLMNRSDINLGLVLMLPGGGSVAVISVGQYCQ